LRLRLQSFWRAATVRTPPADATEASPTDSLTYRVTVTRQMDTSMPFPAFNPYTIEDEPVFDMVTTKGTIRFKLYKDTPLHRENFARLAAGHFFDGILFHRVINGFVIQGGDPFTKDPCRSVEEYGIGDLGYWVPAEIGKKHIRGALGAAREGDDVNPEKMSSSTQFYFVQKEEACRHLDGGYTIFGQTLDGFDVIDSIAAVPTGGVRPELPNEPVRIISVNLVK